MWESILMMGIGQVRCEYEFSPFPPTLWPEFTKEVCRFVDKLPFVSTNLLLFFLQTKVCKNASKRVV